MKHVKIIIPNNRIPKSQLKCFGFYEKINFPETSLCYISENAVPHVHTQVTLSEARQILTIYRFISEFIEQHITWKTSNETHQTSR